MFWEKVEKTNNWFMDKLAVPCAVLLMVLIFVLIVAKGIQ